MAGTLDETVADLGKSIERVKQERDDLLSALAPIIRAYEASVNPGTSDLEQPYHIRLPLGDCRFAARVYRDIIRASKARK